MEESISTIVYIVIFVLIAIFNIAASNKKKAAQQQKKMKEIEQQKSSGSAPVPHVSRTNTNQPPKSIEDFLKNVLGNEEVNQPKPQSQPYAFETEENENTASSEQIVSDADKAFTDYVKAARQPKPVDIQLFEPEIETDEIEEDQTIYKIKSGNFDIKEAVIYSEILNPKFNN